MVDGYLADLNNAKTAPCGSATMDQVPTVFHLARRHQDFSSELSGLGRCSLGVSHLEIDQPVRRSVRIAVRGRRDPADEVFAVLDVNIALSLIHI